MDEIHVNSDSSYKGGRIMNPPLNTDTPTKSVFAIIASSLHKKWSTNVRLLPLSKTTAQELFPINSKVTCDVELNGLSVQVLCTDNNPLNVHLFKLFSPDNNPLNVHLFKLFSPDNKTLQHCVPHPPDVTRSLVLMLDFIHILKSVRNNWINL